MSGIVIAEEWSCFFPCQFIKEPLLLEVRSTGCLLHPVSRDGAFGSSSLETLLLSKQRISPFFVAMAFKNRCSNTEG